MLSCPVCNIEIIKKFGKCCSRACHCKLWSKKASKVRHEKYPNLSKETMKSILEKNPNHQSIAGKKSKQGIINLMNPEVRKRAIAGTKARHMLDPSIGINLGKNTWKNHREKMISMLRDSSNGFGGGNIPKNQYKKDNMRSGWEVLFAKKCESAGFYYQYEPNLFKLKNNKHYLPDFFLEEFNLWIEVKPKYFQTKDVEDKIKECCDNYVILDKKDFDQFFRDLKRI